MILDSSMLSVKNRCEETCRSLNDLSKALTSGSGELHRHFLDCFPELIAAIFGLPLASQQQQQQGSGWISQASSLEEYEALYQLLHGKGNLFSVMVQLSGVVQATHYSFPISCLPNEAIQMLQVVGPGIGSGGPTSAAAAAGGGMGGGGGAMGSFLFARFNRNNQSGLSLNMLEFFLASFAWFATLPSSSQSSSRISSILGGKSLSTSSSSSSSPYSRNMQDTLYSCLIRQYSMVLLELEARSEAVSGASFLRGAVMRGHSGADVSKSDTFFQVYVTIVSLFWLHQNPSQLFFAASAAMTSAGQNKASLYVFRTRYVAPTFLIMCGLYDLMLLLVHSSGDAPAPVATPFASQFQFQHQPAASYQQHGSSAVAIAAGRVASLALREIVLDGLYRVLKLALMFAPNSWPHVASLWHVVVSPWSYAPKQDAQASLARVHERFLAAQQERERRLAYNNAAPPASVGQPAEEFPFSTQILCPYVPESLRSPFVVPVAPTKSSSLRLTFTSQGASAFSGVSNLFNFSGIFGGSEGSSVSSVETPAISPSSSLTKIPVPKNWSWFTFYDPMQPLAVTSPSESSTLADVRGAIVYGYPFYVPLVRTWIEALHAHHVEQTQPLSMELLVGLERLWGVISSPLVLSVLRELDSALHQPLDRFSDGRLEIEKRSVLERWMTLEHSSHTFGLFFADAHLNALVIDLMKEVAMFGRLSSEGRSSAFKTVSENLVRYCERIFGISKTEIDEAVAAASSAMNVATSRTSSSSSSPSPSGGLRLTSEQRAMLREGRLHMDRSNAVFLGDTWDKPVTSSESWVALWILFRLSLLLGLAERKPNATKTYLSLRPLGHKIVLWGVVVLIVAAFVVSRLGKISFGSLFAFDDEE
jgi:hypothetical protein